MDRDEIRDTFLDIVTFPITSLILMIAMVSERSLESAMLLHHAWNKSVECLSTIDVFGISKEA